MLKRITLLALMISFALMLTLPALAQDTGGQFWIQAFEDRNGNGQLDAGEPFLTSGVSVNLLNSSGVVMASATLDNAPYASQGLIGFLYIAPGKYTAVITSTGMTATTPDHIDVTITPGAAPIKALFGAEHPGAVETSSVISNSAPLFNPQIARLAISGFGALIVVGVMIFFGLLIYLLVLRRRAPRDYRRTTTTTGMRAVRVDQTGELHRTGKIAPRGDVDDF